MHKDYRTNFIVTEENLKLSLTCTKL